MKKRKPWLIVWSFVAVILFVFTGLVSADTDSQSTNKSLGIGVDGGYAMFSGDNFNSSAAVNLNFFYNISKQFRIELKGGFIPAKTENDSEGLSKGTLNVIPLQLSLQYRFEINPKWIPYIGVGAGYYLNNYTVENDDVWQNLGFEIVEDVDNVFGFHAGAGIDYFVSSNMAVNLDVRYCSAKLKGTYKITEIDSGIFHNGDIDTNMNLILFSAGLRILF